jgi:asparagine synthase (glutamine-hydrolysing)
MTASLLHRGPDGGGVHVDGPAGLAARRLAIIDLAHGDQPMVNAAGDICVVQNGEILNHRQLRAGLERDGVRLRTACDTEVLLHLYVREGPRFVEQLRGMFALALWDRRERRLLLARDRFGIKPLYYELRDGRISFASELKALLRQPDFSREIDCDALHSFLAFNSIPAPLTIFTGARKLPPGHLLTCSPAGVALERFARPAPAPEGRLRDEHGPALAAELRERLDESVRAHLLADVPVGVLLSGGVDSSVLTALAAQRSTDKLATFSIGFRERSFNELELARAVARRYGTDHHELVVSPQISDLLPKLVAAFDEPFADSSAIPTYLVSELASEHVKVVLCLRCGSAPPPRGWLRSRRGCRAPVGASASTTAPTASRARPTSRRSSAITGGRRSSPPRNVPSCFEATGTIRISIRSRGGDGASPKPATHRCWPGSRTSTLASTSQTTCSSKRIG